MKYIFFFTLGLSFVYCNGQNQKLKAQDLINQSNNLYLNFNLDKNIRLDSCIALIDKVIRIDKKCFEAYRIKNNLLVEKKDISKLLKNNAEIILLKPDEPFWRIQRGIYFDLINNSTEAKRNYNDAKKKYRNLFLTEQRKNIESRIGYLTALKFNEDVEEYEKELKKLLLDFPNNQEVEFYNAEYKLESKQDLLKDCWENILIN